MTALTMPPAAIQRQNALLSKKDNDRLSGSAKGPLTEDQLKR